MPGAGGSQPLREAGCGGFGWYSLREVVTAGCGCGCCGLGGGGVTGTDGGGGVGAVEEAIVAEGCPLLLTLAAIALLSCSMYLATSALCLAAAIRRSAAARRRASKGVSDELGVAGGSDC